ncbi:FUSC family protein [Francisella sp. SYW-9]|uniref:FUSC family protein n=1 Tax=Francisella sp. SYW-9 TaxID=2610888 RepID=UPI00123CBB0E|nr:FUSC family protein [Francisella sp. SYW-9]
MLSKFICLRKSSSILGLSSALTIGLFTAYQVIFDPQNIYGLFAALGCFIATLHQVSIRDHNIKFKLVAGVIFSILISLAAAIGSFYSSNLIVSSIILLIFSFVIGYTAKSDLVFSLGTLFVADMYVIGTGFSFNILDSTIMGVLTFVGAMLFILVFVFLTKKTKILDRNNNIQRSIKVILDLESTLYAISLSLGLIIGNFISIYFNIEIGYWIPMTVLLIFKPDIIRSSKAIKHRLIGTLIGSFFAIPLAIYLFNPYIIWLVLIVSTFFTICCFIKHYGSYVLFLTIFVAMLLKLAHMSGYDISVSRLIYTIIGIVIVAIIIIASRYLKLIFTKN